MMKSLVLTIALIVYGTVLSYAQISGDLFAEVQSKDPLSDGSVTVHQSDEIFQTVNKHVYSMRNQRGVPGYKVCIFRSGELRVAHELAARERSRFLKYYPNVSVEIDYVAPHYTVYVGDFVSRGEAVKFREELLKNYHFTTNFKPFYLSRRIDFDIEDYKK